MKRFVFSPPRLVAATVILAAASALAAWVATYKDLRPAYAPASGHFPSQYVSPAWATPIAALIGITALAMAVLVLRRR